MRRECDCHAMKLYSLALWELNFSHREIILLTKGCKKTNFLIQAEYFSPPLIPLKSFHWHIRTTTPCSSKKVPLYHDPLLPGLLTLNSLSSANHCCGATEGSEQQHNQDLKKIYKGRRILEFITFYHNALHLTRVHCATNNSNKNTGKFGGWESASFTAQT